MPPKGSEHGQTENPSASVVGHFLNPTVILGHLGGEYGCTMSWAAGSLGHYATTAWESCVLRRPNLSRFPISERRFRETAIGNRFWESETRSSPSAQLVSSLSRSTFRPCENSRADRHLTLLAPDESETAQVRVCGRTGAGTPFWAACLA